MVDRLAILTKFGLVVEGDLGPAIGGRAPRHIRFVAEAGTVLVAVLDRSYLGVHWRISGTAGGRASQSDRSGMRTRRRVGPFDDALRLAARRARRQGTRLGHRLGASEPITVDAWDNFAAGDGALSRLQAWRNFDFAGELSLRFGAPSWTRSGTQTMTIGELEAGAGRGASDLLFCQTLVAR